jgi:hypothetical protein
VIAEDHAPGFDRFLVFHLAGQASSSTWWSADVQPEIERQCSLGQPLRGLALLEPPQTFAQALTYRPTQKLQNRGMPGRELAGDPVASHPSVSLHAAMAQVGRLTW